MICEDGARAVEACGLLAVRSACLHVSLELGFLVVREVDILNDRNEQHRASIFKSVRRLKFTCAWMGRLHEGKDYATRQQ